MPTASENSVAVSSTEPIPGLAPITFAVVAAALAGLLFSYDTRVASGIQGHLQSYFYLSNNQWGFAIASVYLGCIAGARMPGTLADRFGRKNILIFYAVLFAISGILSVIPRDITEMSLARIIGGIAAGAASMIAPVYIAEISPEKHRGRFGSLFRPGIVVGIAAAYWVNYFILNAGHDLAGMNWNQAMGWQWMLGSETLPALVFLAILLPTKESPRWLIITDREADARTILTRFFGAVRADGGRGCADSLGSIFCSLAYLSRAYGPRWPDCDSFYLFGFFLYKLPVCGADIT